MDRFIQYGLEQAWAQDTLQGQLNTYLGLSKFMNTVIGTGGINEMVATPTAVPSLNVDVSAGEIYSIEETDVTEYGTAPYSLPADATEILKQGVYAGGTFATPAPGTPGDSVIYLIEAAFSEADGVPVNRPFFGGSPATVNTQRQDLATVQIIAGTPAVTPVAPTPTAGFTGLWHILVANGQTSVLAGDITAVSGTNFFTSKLQDKISLAEGDARYLKLPSFGSGTYYIVGSAALTTIVSTTSLLPLVQGGGSPSGWITGNQLKPDIACILSVSVFGTAALTAGVGDYRIFASLNGAAQIAGVLSSAVGSNEISLSFIQAFNGTTDYVELLGTAQAGTTYDITINNFVATLIQN